MPENKNKFIEEVSNSFYQVLRAAGVTMLPETAHEKIRTIAATLAAAIEHRGEVTAVRVIKRLQHAVKVSFDTVFNDITDLRARVEELEKKVK